MYSYQIQISAHNQSCLVILQMQVLGNMAGTLSSKQ